MTRLVKLGDALSVVIDHRGKTPEKLGGDFVDEGVDVISAIHIKSGRIEWAQRRRFVSQKMFERWMPVRLAQGDLLLTSEAPLGEVALVPDSRDLVLSQRLFALRGKPGELHTAFLYYYFQTEEGQALLLARASGTTVVGIRQSELLKIPVALPPLDEQRRVAEVLGTLDNLIDTNERLGQDLTHLASALGQRLLADIDSGESRSFEEIATITKGYSYKSAELVEGGGWLVGLKNVGRNGVFRPDGFKPLTAKVKPTHVVENGDLVVAQTDLTQAREVIGRPVRVRRGTRAGVLVASLDLAVVRPNRDVPGQFVQSVLESAEFRDHVLGFCNGTTVLHMGSRAIPSFPVLVPDPENLRRFDALTPLRHAADEAFETAESLRRTRDELLPLLMSGAVRVRADGVAA